MEPFLTPQDHLHGAVVVTTTQRQQSPLSERLRKWWRASCDYQLNTTQISISPLHLQRYNLFDTSATIDLNDQLVQPPRTSKLNITFHRLPASPPRPLNHKFNHQHVHTASTFPILAQGDAPIEHQTARSSGKRCTCRDKESIISLKLRQLPT